jgi:hypothetical protein
MPRSPRRVLDLYELGHREPIGFVDPDGVVRDDDGRVMEPEPDEWFRSVRISGWPMILFAEVPALLHLSCGISVAPMSHADGTGPKRTN